MNNRHSYESRDNMKYAFGWRISSTGCSIEVTSEEKDGEAVVLSENVPIARILFNREMVKVNTIKGYVAQVSVNDKYISIHCEETYGK